MENNNTIADKNHLLPDKLNKVLEFAQNSIDAGLSITPVKGKAAYLTGWSNKPLTDVKGFNKTDTGFGIICGTRIAQDAYIHFLDVDTLNKELSQAVKDWLVEAYPEQAKGFLYRTGLAPKFAIPFIMSEATGKQVSKIFYTIDTETGEILEDKAHKNQLEILGKGGQVVAYGTHPDTKKPYEWTPCYVWERDAWQLPEFTQADLDTIKTKFEELALSHGLFTKDKPTTTPDLLADIPAMSTKGGQVLSIAIRAISTAGEGERNDTLNREAFKAFGCVNDGELDEANAYDSLYNAAKACGLEDSEINTTLNSAKKGAASDKRNYRDNQKDFANFAAMFNNHKTQSQTQPKQQTPANTGATGDYLSLEQNAAAKMAFNIEKSLKAKLNEDDLIQKLSIDVNVILKMISGSFWSGQKSKIFLLGYHGGLVQFSEKDAWKFLAKNFGKVVDSQKLNELATVKAAGLQGKSEQKAFIGLVNSIPKNAIIEYIKFNNQRDSIEMRVDMFSGKDGYIQILDEKVRVVYPHKPFVKPLPIHDNAVIHDFKQHFTRFDEFLQLVVMARFARDRKKAYLWLLAHSDWGKGFLLGVFKQLGVVVELSVKEIEAIFEGKPVGRSMQDFKRAFILAVDEFKSVKSEIKQLQSEISLAPKNQLTQSVEVFLKLFLSAESVASLVGEHGVEDQFANRFSIFDEKGTLEQRELFNQIGKAAYFDNVATYVASELNKYIDHMVKQGKQEAEKKADAWLNDFISKHGLDTIYERFSDTLPDTAKEVVTWITDSYRAINESSYIMSQNTGFSFDWVIEHEGDYHLLRADIVLDRWIETNLDFSERASMRKKKTELKVLMSQDGKGTHPRTINGKNVRSILLNA